MQKTCLVFALLIVVIHAVVRRQICGRIVAVGIAAVDCPERTVGSGLNGIEIRASHPALRDLGQLEFGQLRAVAGFDVHPEQRRAVVVVLDFLTVFVGVGLLAVDDTAGEVEVRTRDRRGVHILNVVGNRKIFRLIGVLAGACRLFIVCFGLGAGIIGGICGVGPLAAVFAAAGEHAQQHHKRQQRRNHTIRFHNYSFPTRRYFSTGCVQISVQPYHSRLPEKLKALQGNFKKILRGFSFLDCQRLRREGQGDGEGIFCLPFFKGSSHLAHDFLADAKPDAVALHLPRVFQDCV